MTRMYGVCPRCKSAREIQWLTDFQLRVQCTHCDSTGVTNICFHCGLAGLENPESATHRKSLRCEIFRACHEFAQQGLAPMLIRCWSNVFQLSSDDVRRGILADDDFFLMAGPDRMKLVTRHFRFADPDAAETFGWWPAKAPQVAAISPDHLMDSELYHESPIQRVAIDLIAEAVALCQAKSAMPWWQAIASVQSIDYTSGIASGLDSSQRSDNRRSIYLREARMLVRSGRSQQKMRSRPAQPWRSDELMLFDPLNKRSVNHGM